MAQKWRKGLTFDLRLLPTDADKFYEMDWTDWLAEVQASTISMTTVTSVGGFLTISNVVVRDSLFSVFRVANNTGLLGITYQVDIRITAANGQKETLPVYFNIVN